MNKTSAFSNPLEDQWEMLLHFLPKGWQDAAWTKGAITRWRAIQSATDLLRLILGYAWNDWSLRNTAAWAKRMGLADLSDVAVLNRLRHGPAWLGGILDQWFRSQGIGTALTSHFGWCSPMAARFNVPGAKRPCGALMRTVDARRASARGRGSGTRGSRAKRPTKKTVRRPAR